MSEPADRTELESRWQRNEAELNRLLGLTGLSREMFGAHIDELESAQYAIEFELGRDASAPTNSRRWSGLP
jgi:hypothetical protein